MGCSAVPQDQVPSTAGRQHSGKLLEEGGLLCRILEEIRYGRLLLERLGADLVPEAGMRFVGLVFQQDGPCMRRTEPQAKAKCLSDQHLCAKSTCSVCADVAQVHQALQPVSLARDLPAQEQGAQGPA